ncbi:MAG: glycine cleavage system aminomethyltransferase GcvT [Bacteroidales bacterium]|nr:glycine cleavage system aminomethyltransferase GcvT [Bacteroidales bacterium]
MKDTVFTSIHKKLGARIVPFANYNMPLQYEGVTAEHEAVRNHVGVFDVSHMGEFFVEGPKAFELVQRLTVNDVARLEDGMAQYTCLPNDKDGIVDDFLVYRIDPEKYMMVVNAANIEKDWDWVNRQNINGAKLHNASDEIAQLAVQGPKAEKVLEKLTNYDLSSIKFFHFAYINIAGQNNILVSRTGYTGSGGFELYFLNAAGPNLWKAIFEAGEEYGIKPVGLGARDTLRLEAGLYLYGNDITDTTSPIEAGLGWITKFVDGNNFINRESLEKQKQEGVSRKLKGFQMIEKGIPRQHYEICDATGNPIGEVTSGTMSPTLKKAIGMGYVKTEFAKRDTEIYIKIRKKLVKAKIVKLPFYKPE